MRYAKGDFIGPYKVSLPLGGGAGKEVYRVRDEEGKLHVLIEGATDIEKEAIALSGLSEGTFETSCLMRHVPGETLESRLKRDFLIDPDIALNIVNDVLRQLHRLHDHGIIHHGVKASNIMLELGADPIRAFLIGYGCVSRSGNSDEDIKAVGALMLRMVSGKESDGPVEVPSKILADGFDSEISMMDFIDKSIKKAAPGQKTGPGFSAVAGMDELKKRMQSDVLDILKDQEDAKKYGLSIPNGMLLYGPPGCGKTFFAERFAEEAGYNYHYVKTSDLASVYLHGSQEKIAQLFEKARKEAPSIICFDEFDALAPRRDKVDNASHRAEVNEFLSQLDNCGKDGVFVIATTNRPDNIDPAVLRSGRMDYKIYIPVPDADSRAALFSVMLENRLTDDDINYDLLAEKTDGFLASDINSVVMTAARESFRRKIPIGMECLLSSINATSPSLSKSDLGHYEKIRTEFEKKEDTLTRIGFT